MLTWKEEFGEQIRIARETKGMTQAELARTSSVSRVTINKIEKGRTAPGVEVVAALSAALGGSEFEVRGFRVGGAAHRTPPLAAEIPPQLTLPFGTEQRFKGASITVTAVRETEISLTLLFSDREVA